MQLSMFDTVCPLGSKKTQQTTTRVFAPFSVIAYHVQRYGLFAIHETRVRPAICESFVIITHIKGHVKHFYKLF